MKQRILVVDDNAALAENLAEILCLEGFDASFESDSTRVAGYERCFDAYLVDIAMPKLDGWRLKREVEHRCPSARVVLMSAYDDMPLRAGVDAVTVPLRKPVEICSLLQLLAPKTEREQARY
ncbi:MAG: response regulator [Polyangiales bacterium]